MLREYAIFFPDESLIWDNDVNCSGFQQAKREEIMKTNNQVEAFLFRKSPSRGVLFLVLKRSPEKGGFWQPITGNVKEGETFEEAARREIQEETGITQTLSLIDTGYSFDFFDDNRWQYERVFGAEVGEDTSIVLSREHIEFRWVTKEEALNQYLKWPGNKEGLKKLSEFLEGEKE
ncbi:MAG: NUDIX pyrophosphatase [bacterium]|nr:NUDIX pyrophosphatase [bacterium]